MSDDTETVARIWRQLGSPNYEALNGRSIHDLIDELLANQRPPDFDGPETGGEVTEAVVFDAYLAFNHADPVDKGWLPAMKAALLAVAPLLSAAARRKALEEAAAYCDTMEAGHRARATELEAANIEAATAQDRIANTWGVCAAAIRALGRPA